MAMSDKEFDQLFNEKFEDFSVEPSQQAWHNIETLLGAKKAGAGYLRWIGMAAAVLIIFGGAVLFIKGDEQGTDNPDKTKLALKHEKVGIPTQVDSLPKSVSAAPVQVAKVRSAGKVKSAQVATAVHHNNAEVVSTITEQDQNTTEIERNVVAVTPAPVIQATATILPDKTFAVSTAEPENEPDVPIESSTAPETPEPAKKRGIRSLGGLINILVAKVDKREDKIIEFSDGEDDDDNATKVTGVNLGLIKIKNNK